MQSPTHTLRAQKGFTLIEIIVASGMFLMLSGAITTSIVMFMGTYKHIYADQVLQDELRYAAEFMSRELRMAICGLGKECELFTLIGVSGGYGETDPAAYPSLQFLNYKYETVRYILRNDGVTNVIARRCEDGSGQDCELGGAPLLHPLTSDDINILGLSFVINGDKADMVTAIADGRQPLISFFITAEIRYGKERKVITVQSSLSPRRLQS